MGVPTTKKINLEIISHQQDENGKGVFELFQISVFFFFGSPHVPLFGGTQSTSPLVIERIELEHHRFCIGKSSWAMASKAFVIDDPSHPCPVQSSPGQVF